MAVAAAKPEVFTRNASGLVRVTSLEPVCPAWLGAGSPLTNNRFPYLLDTSAANYFSTTFYACPS